MLTEGLAEGLAPGSPCPPPPGFPFPFPTATLLSPPGPGPPAPSSGDPPGVPPGDPRRVPAGLMVNSPLWTPPGIAAKSLSGMGFTLSDRICGPPPGSCWPLAAAGVALPPDGDSADLFAAGDR